MRRLVTTEILAHKAELARRNLRASGLEGIVDLPVGDALETLADDSVQPDMLVLDGRNDQYVSVLAMLAPRLSTGALVIADLNTDDPDVLAYQHHVRRPSSGFFSVELPLDAGISRSRSASSREPRRMTQPIGTRRAAAPDDRQAVSSDPAKRSGAAH